MADDTDEAVAERLRTGIFFLAGPSNAQRRWVQLGMFQRARSMLDAELGSAARLERAGVHDHEQARLVRAVVDRYTAMRDTRADLLAEGESGPRCFLWSSAFEDPEWHELRHLARQCYAALSAGKAQIING